jgi:hypothetical protein
VVAVEQVLAGLCELGEGGACDIGGRQMFEGTDTDFGIERALNRRILKSTIADWNVERVGDESNRKPRARRRALVIVSPALARRSHFHRRSLPVRGLIATTRACRVTSSRT